MVSDIGFQIFIIKRQPGTRDLKVQIKCYFLIAEFEKAAKIKKIAVYRFLIPTLRNHNATNDGNVEKGHVKLIKQVKIAHSFLVYVKSVPRYHFKLVYVILQMAVKEFFEIHF